MDNNETKIISNKNMKSIYSNIRNNNAFDSQKSAGRVIFKSSINSSIKDYIEGKISANDANKRKESIKINNNENFGINKEMNKRSFTSKNNNNIIISKQLNQRCSVNLNVTSNLFKNISKINESFSENIKDFDNQNIIREKRYSMALIDKTKNLAEVIYIKSYKESNTLEHEEDDKDDNVISTQDKNETIITNCTCNIF